MKVTELLSLGACILEKMSQNGVMRDDYRFVKAYGEFLSMRSKRVKYRAAIKMLADENDVSERTLERIFKRLSGEC